MKTKYLPVLATYDCESWMVRIQGGIIVRLDDDGAVSVDGHHSRQRTRDYIRRARRVMARIHRAQQQIDSFAHCWYGHEGGVPVPVGA